MGYISFPRLSYAGNLASQISQYCALYAIAKNNGLEVVFPESSIYDGWGHKFLVPFNIKLNYISDKYFEGLPLPFLGICESIGKAIKIDGTVKPLEWEYLSTRNRTTYELDKNKNYFVNELFNIYKDFHPKYRDEILSWRWNPDKHATARRCYDKIKVEGKEMVAIHVRRGDYLAHDHFCHLDQDYYNAALEHFVNDINRYHFVIFSNDIGWCKENLIEGDKVTYIDPPGPEYRVDFPIDAQSDCTDLILMSMCDHIIMANSSFSWWASYTNTNPDRKIICPRNYVKWYSSVAEELNGQYYLPEWTPVNNSDQV